MKRLSLFLLASTLLTTCIHAGDSCIPIYKAENYPAAEQCFLKELKKGRSWNTLFGLGVSLAEQQRYTKALPYFEEAEKKAETLSNFASVYSYLGTVHGSLKHPEKEYFYSMKYLEIALQTGKNTSISRAYNNLGWYAEKQNQSEKSQTYNNLAVLYDTRLHNTQKAEEMYLKAIALDVQSGDYNNLGLHKANLGIFYYDQKRYSEAKAILNEALPIANKAGLRETKVTIIEALEGLKNK